MLSRILRLSNAIKIVLNMPENTQFKQRLLTANELALVKELASVLYPFFHITQKLCGEKYTTRSIILPYLYTLKKAVIFYLFAYLV